MIVTILFVPLVALALAGAAGVLLLKKIIPGICAFLLSITALAGLYFLLDASFLAALQLFFCFLSGSALIWGAKRFDLAAQPTRPESPKTTAPARPNLARLLVFVPLALILAAVAGWAIVRGRIGAAVLQSPPLWAVQGEYIPALGQELLANNLVPFELIGLFLLIGLVIVARLSRSARDS